MSGAPIPERPRLAPGVRVFPCSDGLAVRSQTFAMLVEADRRTWVAEAAARLDGRRVTEICGELGLVPVLKTLGDLAEQGLLVEADSWRTRPPDPEAPRGPRLDGTAVQLLGSEPLADAVARELEVRGAAVRRVDTLSTGGGIAVAVRAGPDLDALETLSDAALRAGLELIPVFTLADDLLVGPRVRAGAACLRCLVLRWLGISRAIRLEREYFDDLRRGGWRVDAKVAEADGAWLARRAADILTPGLAGAPETDGIVVTSIASGERRERRLFPHSLCPVCGEGATPASGIRAEDWNGVPLPLDELSARLEPLLDDRIGMAALEPPPPRGTEPGLPSVALVRFAVPRPERVQASQQNWTHGCAATPGEARTLAIVEALERYSGIAPPRHERIASYDEVRDEALDPTTLPLFSEAQYRRPGFRFERFEAGRALRWVRGFSLTRGAPRYVPASAAHYGEADTLVEETSSGMAAHTARRPALLSALSELLERDAFMIHWLNRLSPPIVDVEGSGDARVTPFLEFVKRRGWEPRVLDLTTDLGFPVYLATGVREDGRGAALLVGAGASLDPAWAMLRALRELYSAVVAQAETFTPPPPLRAEEVERMQQHIDFYQDPKNLSRAAFLWASSRRAPAPKPGSAAAGDPSDPLTEAVRRLSTHGLELIGVDVTAPDVARHGLFVVRALVPGLQPLAFGRSYLRLGGRRLYEAPQRMGHRAAPTTEAELNPDPHCFP